MCANFFEFFCCFAWIASLSPVDHASSSGQHSLRSDQSMVSSRDIFNYLPATMKSREVDCWRMSVHQDSYNLSVDDLSRSLGGMPSEWAKQHCNNRRVELSCLPSAESISDICSDGMDVASEVSHDSCGLQSSENSENSTLLVHRAWLSGRL